MLHHAPDNYICPICLEVQGVESEHTLIVANDVVYRDKHVMVFVASYFIGRNDGHLIVAPTDHYEHIYDLPDETGAHIFKIAKKMAALMTAAYGCPGVTTLQNNGPAAGQHAFHYHLHLFPRYVDDDIYAHMNAKRQTTPKERTVFVEKIRELL